MEFKANEKTCELIRYLISKHPKPSVTVLMKLCYLIDLVNIKKNESKVTDFDYIRYRFGPFDKKIYSYLDFLTENNLISPEQGFATESANDFIVYTQGESGLVPSELKDEDIKSADEVLAEVSGYGAKALTDITYKTKPMLKLGATRGGTENLFKELDLKQ